MLLSYSEAVLSESVGEWVDNGRLRDCRHMIDRSSMAVSHQISPLVQAPSMLTCKAKLRIDAHLVLSRKSVQDVDKLWPSPSGRCGVSAIIGICTC